MTFPRLSRVSLVLTALVLAALACTPTIPDVDVSGLFTPTPPPRPTEGATATPLPTATTVPTPTPLPGASSISPEEMSASLNAVELTELDPFELGASLGILDEDESRTLGSAPTWEVGDTESFAVGIENPDGAPFFGIDPTTGEEVVPAGRIVDADLHVVNDEFYVWVDTSATNVSDQMLDSALVRFMQTGHTLVQQMGGLSSRCRSIQPAPNARLSLSIC
jgi:hypothetical protein